ncbi:MAG: ergothioneine biosynthesis protein EgtB [Chloroflexi bacterium]|nr:ergothioneine biosynthesis protein EgtB [Chloroflexota bacterium]
MHLTAMPGAGAPTGEGRSLASRYREVRSLTEALCATLVPEDFVIQAMPDVSPTKWHLAHVSWFFETFLLKPFLPSYRPIDPRYEYLFNSYYNTVGPQFSRPNRGHLSRPTVAEVFAYRAHVDDGMAALFELANGPEFADRVELGLNHEQQHQELLLTDIKFNLSVNPLRPVFQANPSSHSTPLPPQWVRFSGGIQSIGHDGNGFSFDNEGPRHEVLLAPFQMASRLVTNAEFLEFIADGGYERPELWLSAGRASAQTQGGEAPRYWERSDDGWQNFTLGGMQPVDLAAPVCHVSYYEADAFARWAGERLPTEQEWEHAASAQPIEGNFLESGAFHPGVARSTNGAAIHLSQLYGDVWEWTGSAYLPYPGFRPLDGNLGEYNGKFVVNQMVLRGGSCVTPRSHIRASYRNFFPPDARWQFTGIRLASDG